MSRHRPLPCALACLDLDGTLIDPEGDSASRETLSLLLTVATALGTRLAYATGRGAAEVHQLVAAGELPRPGFLLAELGTVLYAWEEDGPREMAESPAWTAWDGPLIERLAGARPELRPRRPERSGPYKKTFTVDAGEQAAVREILARQLTAAGLRVHLLFEPPSLLFVVPAGSGKEVALRVLRSRLGIAAADVLAAGDGEVGLGAANRAVDAEFRRRFGAGFVRQREEFRGEFEAERSGGPEVDDELDIIIDFDGNLGRIGSL